MSLHYLIATHIEELIERTKAKVAARRQPNPGDAELEREIPLFLARLVAALDAARQETKWGNKVEPAPRGDDAMAPGTTLPGHLRKFYVEVCEAVTELAFDRDAALTPAEAQALDACLDSVLASAITTWTEERSRPRLPGAAAGDEGTVEAEPEAERGTVLVVDRDPHIRRLIRQFVSEAYDVEFLDDGCAALERVRTSPPTAIITEIMVPRLDGLALCRLLKSDPRTQHVPILVFSMLAGHDRARESGADAFLAKPVEKKRLMASLHSLRAARAGQGARLGREHGAA